VGRVDRRRMGLRNGMFLEVAMIAATQGDGWEGSRGKGEKCAGRRRVDVRGRRKP
jgi:hypothetical protein